MPQVRAGSAEKWKRRTANATEEFVNGVNNPRANWQSQTIAAEGNYQQGVTAAIQRKAFGKGVQKVSNDQYKAITVAKGQTRFADGVNQSEGKFEAGVRPYLDVIASTTLPPRGPKGSPQNFERSKVMGMTLRNKKLSLTGN